MERPNILVIGNSGAGKSTLINSILDSRVARESLGEKGTKDMDIYESPGLPFRLIDSRGIEYSRMAQVTARRQIDRWIKRNLDEERMDRCVSMIWYCVDAMSARLFAHNIKMLKKVTRFWKDIPVIVVLTKSYSAMQRTENERMVYDQILKHAGGRLNVKDVISVVACEMPINEATVIPPSGLGTLIDRTVDLAPEAMAISAEAVKRYKLAMKRKLAHSFTATVAAGAAVVGASPVPVADAAVLVPVQTALVKGVTKIYDMDGKSGDVMNIIVECGTVSVAARAAVSSLKGVLPGIGNIINAVVAAVFSGAIGKITIAVMEKLRSGDIRPDEILRIRVFTETRFKGIVDRLLPVLRDMDPSDFRDIRKVTGLISRLISSGHA